MKTGHILLLIALAALIALFFAFDLHRFLTTEHFSAQRQDIAAFQQENPWLTGAAFFALYVLVAALSLPGAAPLTLIAGALFGLGGGLVIVSFASSLGATLAFLIARHLFRDAARARFRRQLAVIDRGVEREGAFYLFALRLAPIFPFFAVNLAMAATPLATWTFYWVSQAGMLAGTVVYVNAGAQLGRIESLAGILSPTLMASFALLGLFPLLAKKALGWVKSRAARRRRSGSSF